MSKNSCSENKEIRNRLCNTMRERRTELGFSQKEAAHLLDRDEKTYQRWESDGDGLSNLFVVLNIFRVLQFSLTDIIYVLGLPPLTLREIEELYQDEEMLKNIRESSLYSYIKQTRGGMETITIEKLLDTLMAEHLRRKNIIK